MDRRRSATRQALIEAAETLFADRGIDGVSLREIGEAIGSGNFNVVGYHFGSKEALVDALFEYRLPWLDLRRGELLEQAAKGELGALMDALWRPLFEQTNAQGMHSYAGFLAALLSGGKGALRSAVSDRFPATNRLVEQIHDLVEPEVPGLFDRRLRISALIVTGMLRIIDQCDDDAELLFSDAIRMATAAMGAGLGKGTH